MQVLQMVQKQLQLTLGSLNRHFNLIRLSQLYYYCLGN